MSHPCPPGLRDVGGRCAPLQPWTPFITVQPGVGAAKKGSCTAPNGVISHGVPRDGGCEPTLCSPGFYLGQRPGEPWRSCLAAGEKSILPNGFCLVSMGGKDCIASSCADGFAISYATDWRGECVPSSGDSVFVPVKVNSPCAVRNGTGHQGANNECVVDACNAGYFKATTDAGGTACVAPGSYCSLPNGQGRMTPAGACLLVSCNPPFVAENGRCLAPSLDTTSRDGEPCVVAHGKGSLRGGVCVPASCDDGYAIKDGACSPAAAAAAESSSWPWVVGGMLAVGAVGGAAWYLSRKPRR